MLCDRDMCNYLRSVKCNDTRGHCERDMCNYLSSVMTLEAHWLLAATLHYLDCCDNTGAGQCLKAAKHTNIDNVG